MDDQLFNDILEMIKADTIESYEIIDIIAQEGEIDRRLAYQFYQIVLLAGKQQVKNELKKQAENMLFWVDKV